MGWRERLGLARPTRALVELRLEGEERVAAVGESFYQPALLAACGGKRGDAQRFPCTARLVPQPDNQYDKNAVAVLVSGQQVGHLARPDAAVWQPLLVALQARGQVASCEAMIAGRGREGETENLGVFLHLPTLTEARAQVGL